MHLLSKIKSSSCCPGLHPRLPVGFCSAILFAALILFVPSPNALASSPPAVDRVSQRNPEFVGPEKLRGRVKFWVDVFTKYGKNYLVFHHREYIGNRPVSLHRPVCQFYPEPTPRLVAESLKFQFYLQSITKSQIRFGIAGSSEHRPKHG